MPNPRILIVEDDRSISDLLEQSLREQGYRVDVARDGESGLTLFREHGPDLVLLDLKLPGIDGYEVCRRIRATAQTPVLMLTARDEEVDKVVGLELIESLEIDLDCRTVARQGIGVELTTTEFDLLATLASHPGQVFSRKQLLERVWGYHFEGYERTVDSHVTRLRKKVEAEPDRPELILTVRGVGYKFKRRETGPARTGESPAPTVRGSS
ncbi:MAG: response regulator transcription factor [Candidatus Wallbacteria bacterium]|nr:response regulator transcription factor [Candidatus Wallbacteria bacterium]